MQGKNLKGYALLVAHNLVELEDEGMNQQNNIVI
jgi:hypothetical protein